MIITSLFFAVRTLKKKDIEVTYREYKVSRSDMELTILSTGYVQPENRLEIKPPIAGRVEKVLVDEGYKVKRGTILAWMSSTERAALIDAARARGPEELKKWEDLYRATPIIAPIDGTIIQRNVESGQVFSSNDYILVMSDRLTVKANVDETDIAQVKIGQVAQILLDAYPSKAIDGKVVQIAHEAKTVSNVTTYVVDILPLKTPDFMRSGMTANVVFYVAKQNNVLTIPAEAVKVIDNNYYVLMKPQKIKDKPKERRIKLGLNDGSNSEVLEGLSEKDVILIPEIKTIKSTNKASSPFSPVRPGARKR
jgi:macrolide-specific efflux system membrane fusion protein